MADNTTISAMSGGDVIADEDIGGVKHQLVKVEFGAAGSATRVDPNNGLPVAQQSKSFTATAAANNTDLVSQDCLNYRWASFTLSGTFTATVSFQMSNDGTNWQAAVALRDAAATWPTTATSTGMYSVPIMARYFRVRVTAYTSGTVQIDGFFSPAPPPQLSTGTVAAPASVPVSYGAGTFISSITPGTTGGWSVYSNTALSTTVGAVKASQGTFGGYMIYNPNATVAYVQVFNVASGSVTLGTTAPTYVLSVPATSAVNLELANGVQHSTAISVAATTTPTGSTALGTALTVAVFFK